VTTALQCTASAFKSELTPEHILCCYYEFFMIGLTGLIVPPQAIGASLWWHLATAFYHD